MNAEDEVFLTAYLDGELDSENRLRVETAMLSDARLLDHLHALAAVREMVASLPRATLSPDVSKPVIDAINRRRQAGVLGFQLLPDGIASWSVRAGAFATAAALLLAILFGLRHRTESGAGPVVVVNPTPPTAPVSDPAIESARIDEPVPEIVVANPVHFPVADPFLTQADRTEESNRRQVLDLLDRTDSPRTLVVKSAPDSGATERINKLLEESAFRNARFARFRISQGVHVDPTRPGEATVFAVILDDSEFRELRFNLRTAFQDSLVEDKSSPEVVTQLADVNDIALSQARAVAGLRLPDSPATAIRTEPASDGVTKKSVTLPDGEVIRHPDGQTTTDGSSAVAETRPSKSNRDQKNADSTIARTPPGPASQEKPIEVDREPTDALILIWVTSFTIRNPRFP